MRTCYDRYPVRHIEDFAYSLHDKLIFSTIDRSSPCIQPDPSCWRRRPEDRTYNAVRLIWIRIHDVSVMKLKADFSEIHRGGGAGCRFLLGIIVSTTSSSYLHHLKTPPASGNCFNVLRNTGSSALKCVVGQPELSSWNTSFPVQVPAHFVAEHVKKITSISGCFDLF